ncbi:DinB family protein [Streptomyces luteoverticillatus]|uniref:DinB family protein n=1 Tax=Streptomyces luteoverticillatus TaxID=66425 RepID=A0A3S9PDZ3_STRLT|nr:DinB family protein [Streptomyces luteoverticillatus]AZQ70563.1 DinB family protein [Streptomyces luteoverticillatus]
MTINERPLPSTTAGEREMLEGWLDFHRATLAAKCAGLDDEQLRTASAPPSIMSLMGLMRHMAEVERHWFRRVLSGEDAPPIYYDETDRDKDFKVTKKDTGEEALATWQAEIAKARELAAERSLDYTGAGVRWREGEPFSLRWILTHMIEEYARHNGHADLIRERVDGATGF